MEKDRFTFVQYIGLRDRNSKEIYERDIILIIHDDYLKNFKIEKG